jgi:hypothetical protein
MAKINGLDAIVALLVAIRALIVNVLHVDKSRFRRFDVNAGMQIFWIRMVLIVFLGGRVSYFHNGKIRDLLISMLKKIAGSVNKKKANRILLS